MSACDTCIQPGACCKNIPLYSIRTDLTALEVLVMMASYDVGNATLGLPFYDPQLIPDDGGIRPLHWELKCSWLTPEGRCGNYDLQPYWPCGAYQAGADLLCVHHVPEIGLCPDMKQPVLQRSKHYG